MLVCMISIMERKDRGGENVWSRHGMIITLEGESLFSACRIWGKGEACEKVGKLIENVNKNTKGDLSGNGLSFV